MPIVRRYAVCLALLLLIGGGLNAQTEPPDPPTSFDTQQLALPFLSDPASSRLGSVLNQMAGAQRAALEGGSSLDLGPFGTLVQPGSEPRVVVDATAAPGSDAQSLLADLQALGLQHGSTYERMVGGSLPVSALAAANDLTSLGWMRISTPLTRQGSTTSQGDASQQSDIIRNGFALNGSGVRIGTISDSYNCLNGANADIASGDLPPAERLVILTDDLANCPDRIDEGRAMMQLIHDSIPGATQLFYPAFLSGQAGLANAYIQLANAGADVISDDVAFLTEPFFQDGVIAQAVDTVVNQGIPVFTSAGNNDDNAYIDDFRTSTNVYTVSFVGGVLRRYNSHDFNAEATLDDRQRIVIPPGSSIRVSVQWEDRYASASPTLTPAASTDVDILLINNALDLPVAVSASNNIGGDPVEFLTFTNPTVNAFNQNFSLLILRLQDTPDPGRIMAYYDSIRPNEYVGAPTVFGHANSARGAGVAAAFWGETPRFGVNPPLPEPFTSLGGVPILFDVAGNPVNIVRNQPRFTGPDGGNTTFFGSDTSFDADSFPNFFGTSAAAPQVAAVAAQLLQADPDLTPDDIYALLAASAIDMSSPGYDLLTGTGLVQADAALAALYDRYDHDDNGFITAVDAIRVVNALDTANAAFDYNGNGVVDVQDVLRVIAQIGTDYTAIR